MLKIKNAMISHPGNEYTHLPKYISEDQRVSDIASESPDSSSRHVDRAEYPGEPKIGMQPAPFTHNLDGETKNDSHEPCGENEVPEHRVEENPGWNLCNAAISPSPVRTVCIH